MTKEEAIEIVNKGKCPYPVSLKEKEKNEAFDMAISALSAEGEYIKKEDLFNKTIKRNSIWNGTTNAEGKGLEEIVNDLPTYTFPDSAENKGEWIYQGDEISGELKCSVCGETVGLDGENYRLCPYCGSIMRGDKAE